MEVLDFKNMLLAQENYNLYDHLCQINKQNEREIIFLCVGNSKIWFDSFGPIIGSVLKKLNIEKFIYGNVESNINSENLKKYVELIYNYHTNPYIVVFDSAISSSLDDCLLVKNGEIKCACLSKEPIMVGDLGITYNMTMSFAKNPENYLKMISKIKNLVRILYFLLKQ